VSAQPAVPADEVRLEPMRWWHVEACVALERDLFPADAWSPETFWSELARVPDSRHYLVALDAGGRVVGYAGLSALPPEADIQTLAVAPSGQGRGLGSRLLDALLAEAARRGATTVLLEVRADNEAALHLYGRRGFVPIARRRDYYAPGVDAVVMKRPPGADRGRP
jgi:ribosomal-protein-alanine N-acetyltransferase